MNIKIKEYEELKKELENKSKNNKVKNVDNSKIQ